MWELNDNSDAILSAFEQKIQMGLEAVGIEAEDNVALLSPVDTGRLKGSITHVVDDHTVVVGTNVEYAVRQELGDYQHEVGQAHYMRDGIQRTRSKAIMSAALHTY